MTRVTYAIPDDMLERHIRNFTYQPPTEGQPEKYGELRGEAKELGLLILSLTPRSREQSLALTKLEEVVMWANAAIARNE